MGRAAGLRDNWGPDFVATHGSTMPPPGVETRARQMQPAPPMINTVASDRVASLGRNGPAMSSAPAMQALPMMRPAAAPVNPLGGMDPRSLSSRSGGPMSYAPRGVGTNNPNAYAVGKNNKNFAMRTNPSMQAPMQQAPLMPQSPPPGMMMGASAPAAQALMAPAPAGMAPAPAGRDDAFWSQMSADTSGFMAAQDKLGAAETQAGPAELYALEGVGGYVPMMRQSDGTSKAAGGFLSGPVPDSSTLPLPPQSMEAQAQAIAKQAQEQEKVLRGQGMMPVPPKQATDAAGRTYAPDPQQNGPRPFTGKIQSEGGIETTDPKTGKKTTSPPRQFTVMEDPATGKLVKRYVEDANGDGVVAPAEKAAPSWMDWLNSQSK